MCVEVSVMANVTIRMDEGLKSVPKRCLRKTAEGAILRAGGPGELTAPIGLSAVFPEMNWSCSNAAGITEIEGATERVTPSMHKLSH